MAAIAEANGIPEDRCAEWDAALESLPMESNGASFAHIQCDTAIWMSRFVTARLAAKVRDMGASKMKLLYVLPDEPSAEIFRRFLGSEPYKSEVEVTSYKGLVASLADDPCYAQYAVIAFDTNKSQFSSALKVAFASVLRSWVDLKSQKAGYSGLFVALSPRNVKIWAPAELRKSFGDVPIVDITLRASKCNLAIQKHNFDAKIGEMSAFRRVLDLEPQGHDSRSADEGTAPTQIMVCVLDEKSSHSIVARTLLESPLESLQYAIITPRNILIELKTLDCTKPILLFVDPTVRFLPLWEVSTSTAVCYRYAALADFKDYRLEQHGAAVVEPKDWALYELQSMTALGENSLGQGVINVIYFNGVRNTPVTVHRVETVLTVSETLLLFTKLAEEKRLALQHLRGSNRGWMLKFLSFARVRLGHLGLPLNNGSGLPLWTAGKESAYSHWGESGNAGCEEGGFAITALRNGIVRSAPEARMVAAIKASNSTAVKAALATVIAISRIGLSKFVDTSGTNASGTLETWDSEFRKSRLWFLAVSRGGMSYNFNAHNMALLDAHTFGFIDQERRRILQDLQIEPSSDIASVGATEADYLALETVIVESWIHNLLSFSSSSHDWVFHECFTGETVGWADPATHWPKHTTVPTNWKRWQRTQLHLVGTPDSSRSRRERMYAIHFGAEVGNVGFEEPEYSKVKHTVADIVWVREAVVHAVLGKIFSEADSAERALLLFRWYGTMHKGSS